MHHLVVGLGEVGSAVREVLKTNPAFWVDGIDRGGSVDMSYDVLHICFPWSDTFVSNVMGYAAAFGKGNALIIIHSTVPVGTTAQIPNAVHSPIRGVHPNLAKGIRTFTKFFGGERAEEAARVFLSLGIRCQLSTDSRNTEALKLLDTTYYGWNIIFEKGVHDYCERYGLDFNLIYTQAGLSYNEGYTALGRPEVVRPVLQHMDGPIGGHCVIPNCKLLDTSEAAYILERNAAYDVQRHVQQNGDH